MPINLAGSYAAGGLHDALLEIVKQRMLEQELAQRQEENQFQRLRADRLDKQHADETTYQRGRDTLADTRQAEVDRLAKETRDQQNQIGRFNLLKGQPDADIKASLGEDLSTGQTVPTAPNPAIPGNMPAYAIGQNTKTNPMMMSGVKIRPPSAEALNKEAEIDKERDIQGQIRVAQAKPVSRTELTAYIGPHGEPVQQDQEGHAFIGTEEVPLSSLRLKPPQTSSNLSPGDALSATLRLRSDFRRETTAAQTAVKQYQLMEDALKSVKEGRSAAGSQGVLVTFQKILDPNSVVRESEYARSAAGQALLARLEGSWERIVKGGAGVPVSELQAFVTTAKGFAQKQAEYASTTKEQIDHIAKKYGLEPADITRDLVTELGGAGGGDGNTPVADTPLPPMSQRVVGKTEAVIKGKPMIWGAGGWVPK